VTGSPIVHFVEPGGHGGVFHHTAELARLVVCAGGRAVIHTAIDCERLDFDTIVVCPCVDWYRHVRLRRFRASLIAARYLLVTLPHLMVATEAQIVHLHGLFKSPLYAITLRLLKWRSSRTVFSPHNTFARSGRRWEVCVLRWAVRRSDFVVCYSEFDASRLAEWGVSAVVCPLWMWVPRLTVEEIASWKVRLCGDHDSRIILMPGQIRADKGIDQMILAAPLLRVAFRLAVVGEDKGDLWRCEQLADENGIDVTWINAYVTIQELSAAIAAADVVALPYSCVSQSGVASLANSLGTPTVAYPVGGLPELATVTAARCDPPALAEAIMRVLTTPNWSMHEPPRTLGPLARVYRA
jgi:glycosyltransferase involved in cell wall biosynthesis